MGHHGDGGAQAEADRQRRQHCSSVDLVCCSFFRLLSLHRVDGKGSDISECIVVDDEMSWRALPTLWSIKHYFQCAPFRWRLGNERGVDPHGVHLPLGLKQQHGDLALENEEYYIEARTG